MAKKSKSARSSSVNKYYDVQSLILVLAGALVVLLCLYFIAGSNWFPINKHFASIEQLMPQSASSMDMQKQNTMGDSGSNSAEQVVTISNNTYNPDTVVHTATVYPNSLDTGNIAPGQEKTILFKTAGTYTYHCLYHSYMTGTIIVQ